MFTFTVIAALLCITTGFNTIATVISWRRAKAKFGFYFAVGMTSVTLWTLASAFDYAAVPIPLKIFFTKWEYIFYHMGEAFFLLFILSYAGYGKLAEGKPLRAVLWIICGSNILLAWTNDWHGWLWSGFSPGEFGNNTVIFEHGPAFLWVLTTGYLLYGGIILVAWLNSRRGSANARRQGRIMLYAFLLPLLGNLVYQFQPPELKGMDWASVFISGSSMLSVWALYGTNLLDIIPIAREKLIEGLSDGMIVLDMQGRIVEINQPAAQMMKALPENLVGKNLEEFPVVSQSISGHPPEQEIRTEIEIGAEEKRYFDVLITPLIEKQSQVAGRLIIFRDMTIRKENELRLLQLTQAIEQSPTSVVITDLNGNISYVNPQFTSLTGYTVEEVVGKNPSILKSGQTPLEIYQDMWETIKTGGVWRGEFLNRKKNGELYWEQATMAPVLNKDGQPINFIAIKTDITENKKVEAALSASEKRFRQLMISAPDAVLSIDETGRIIFANREASNLLGYKFEELIGSSIDMLLPENLSARHAVHRAKYLENLRTRAMGSGMELTARRKNGDEFPVDVTLSYSEGENGTTVIAFMRDITDRKRAEKIWKELAATDPLTGLLNRRELFRRAETELERARRYEHSLSTILLDVDHFKNINDTYGHAAGDSVLVSLAQLLTREIRAVDLAARYGGEEFMLLLPETSLERAYGIAERIRSTVADTPVMVDGQTIRFTISLGVTSSENVGNDFESLLKESDRLLYQAKQSGRNRVVSH